MSSLLHYLTMGCVCGKETINVQGRTFYIRSRLGEGGFSYIDLIEDAHSHKLFALKRIVCHSNGDEKVAEAEIKYMMSFNHPNLVPCEAHEKIPVRNSRIGVQSEVLIVMPYYRRGSVWDEIELNSLKNKPMAESRILHLIKGMCDGLKAMHSHEPTSYAHRDIKPHNVMLTDDNTPVLMDFGSVGPARHMITTPSEARALQDEAAERCTMPYRAPELFNVEVDSIVDEKIDMWSVGCTAYAMCFGASPFDDAYQKGGSIALAVLSKVRIPENHGYSSGLITLIDDMLTIDPQQRPELDAIIQRVVTLQNAAENRV